MTSRYHDVWPGLTVARRVVQDILYSLLYNCPPLSMFPGRIQYPTIHNNNLIIYYTFHFPFLLLSPYNGDRYRYKGSSQAHRCR